MTVLRLLPGHPPVGPALEDFLDMQSEVARMILEKMTLACFVEPNPYDGHTLPTVNPEIENPNRHKPHPNRRRPGLPRQR